MRWSIIRVIWYRDLRDQLRDRRTILMMVALPLLLYPALGFGVFQFAVGLMKRPSVVGVIGAENLPGAAGQAPDVRPAAAWLAATPGSDGIGRFAGAAALASVASESPLPPGANRLPAVAWLTAMPSPGGPAPAAGAAALALAARDRLRRDYPPLLATQDGTARFAPGLLDPDEEARPLHVRLLDGDAAAGADVDRSALDGKQVDVLLVVPPDFRARLDAGGRPVLHVLTREGDDVARGVSGRLYVALAKWKKQLKEVRLLRRGLPADFDDPFVVHDPERAKPMHQRATDDLFDILLRILPFILIMWSLVGALYPAVDLCAGEKERGTMETLLISPAGREEIVLGKFLTIWVFSAASALMNLASITLTTWTFSGVLPRSALSLGPLLWCVVLLLPLSAFFSALCLAVGAYARSSKE
ncbi:MAG TPA: ABC transporter permease subunit, partial [Gemmataceae bacterium]|nr:ABC transporter permease subunit [Gemmataceae bacterium]